MTFKLAVYHKSVPNKNNSEKTQMLEFFGLGARNCGDTVVDVRGHHLEECDIAVIQGWIAQDVHRPHLQLRNDVIARQIGQGRRVVTADSNLFLYADTSNALHYLRYSFNGVFPNTGIYFDSTVDPSRWNKISKDLHIAIKDYRTNGNHILICLQRNNGWSMGTKSVRDWTEETIRMLRRYTDRPIRLRAHPGDQKSQTYTSELAKLQSTLGFDFSNHQDIRQDFANCWAVVNHNSSPAVAATIEGLPVFVTDPERSQCRAVANTNLGLIENPTMPDRTDWLNRLAMSHWKFDELKSGEAWAHMRNFVRDTV